MKRTLVSLLAAITLLSTAHVQTRDEFNGGFSLQWSWKLPDNDPFCTLFDNAVSFGSGSMTIQTRDGAMFGGFNSHRMCPPCVLLSGVIRIGTSRPSFAPTGVPCLL